MTTSPTPEQSARAILDIFKSQNCIAGDPLKISYIKTKFLESVTGTATDLSRDLHPPDTLALTAVGFAEI